MGNQKIENQKKTENQSGKIKMGKSKIGKVMCPGSLHGCMYTKLRNRGIHRKK